MNTFNVSVRPAFRALAIGLAVAISVAGLSVLTTSSSQASTKATVRTGTYEKRVQHWVNRKRAKHGLGKLRLQSCTDHRAERWAKRLVREDAFYHQDMGQLLKRCNAYYAGETLGRGSITPRTLVRLWMHSPPHRAVLLSKSARRIGVGSYRDRHGNWLTAANFTKL